MTVSLFGVTAAIVKADYLPQVNEFSPDSNPTLASVNRYLDQKAAVLEAKLLQEGIAASGITVSTDAPYLWCQATLTLMVAIRAMEAMTQQDAGLLKTWRDELDARWAELAAKGYLALGTGTGVAAPSTQPDGPNHFIDALGIDLSDNEADHSGITARLRRDDEL